MIVLKRRVSLNRTPDDLLPCAVVKLLRDGNRPSMKFERVIFRVEVLHAEVRRRPDRSGKLIAAVHRYFTLPPAG